MFKSSLWFFKHRNRVIQSKAIKNRVLLLVLLMRKSLMMMRTRKAASFLTERRLTDTGRVWMNSITVAAIHSSCQSGSLLHTELTCDIGASWQLQLWQLDRILLTLSGSIHIFDLSQRIVAYLIWRNLAPVVSGFPGHLVVSEDTFSGETRSFEMLPESWDLVVYHVSSLIRPATAS